MKRKKIVVAVVLVAVVLLAGWAVHRWLTAGAGAADRTLTASGTVEATDAVVGFRMPGEIASIVPREGDPVAAGQRLARLAHGELSAEHERAAAQVAAAEARLAELERGSRAEEIAQARSRAAAAEHRRLDAARDLERTRTLYAGGAVPAEALDKAELARDLAAADVEQAEEALALVTAGPRRERIAAARAELAAARGALAVVEARLADAEIVAPFAGVVQVRHREPGEVVAAGSPVLTLADLSSRWVRIYVPENRVGAVHLGTEAEIRSDTYPDRAYRGEVFFVATEAEFTPENVQTREERVRLVYAVKVRVVGDAANELKPGMPVDVEMPLPPAAGAEAG